MQDHLHALGIMTGNSLDGADLVLTRFGRDGSIADVGAHAVPFPEDLKAAFRALRGAVIAAGGRVEALDPGLVDRTAEAYTALLVSAVAELRARVGAVPVDLIGLHGQTCGHRPPSIAERGGDVWTVQLGDGQALADRTALTVVCDFRSDDLMAGGEGAPLAPSHHRHLAASIRGREIIGPLAVVNAGNTGNLSLIAANPGATKPWVVGWDAGPFNHFPDRIMQLEAGQPCDWDGTVGRQGRINLTLLGLLFDRAVVTGSGANFLLQPPPRSSDPAWYRLLPELMGTGPVGGAILPREDRVRTATYFASYILAHSLSLIPPGIDRPTHFAVCGGGWRNPLCVPDFGNLLRGDPLAPVLPEHAAVFERLRTGAARVVVEPTSRLGFDPTAMEARIFADAAVCRLKGEPFTLPSITGVARPTVCGVIRWPEEDRSRATAAVRAWLDHFGTDSATYDPPSRFDRRWSRASAGWIAIRQECCGR